MLDAGTKVRLLPVVGEPWPTGSGMTGQRDEAPYVVPKAGDEGVVHSNHGDEVVVVHIDGTRNILSDFPITDEDGRPYDPEDWLIPEAQVEVIAEEVAA